MVSHGCRRVRLVLQESFKAQRLCRLDLGTQLLHLHFDSSYILFFRGEPCCDHIQESVVFDMLVYNEIYCCNYVIGPFGGKRGPYLFHVSQCNIQNIVQ